MRTQEVVKEDVHGNQIIGTGEGVETTFGVIPGFELAIERLNEIVGDPVVEISDTNMLSLIEKQGNRLNIGAVTIRNDGRTRTAEFVSTISEDGMGSIGVPGWRKMKVQNKAGFSVKNKPEVVVFATNGDIRLIAMPFIRAREVELRDSPIRNDRKDASELEHPLRDGDMGQFNLMLHPQEFRNLTRG